LRKTRRGSDLRKGKYGVDIFRLIKKAQELGNEGAKVGSVNEGQGTARLVLRYNRCR